MTETIAFDSFLQQIGFGDAANYNGFPSHSLHETETEKVKEQLQPVSMTLTVEKEREFSSHASSSPNVDLFFSFSNPPASSSSSSSSSSSVSGSDSTILSVPMVSPSLVEKDQTQSEKDLLELNVFCARRTSSSLLLSSPGDGKVNKPQSTDPFSSTASTSQQLEQKDVDVVIDRSTQLQAGDSSDKTWMTSSVSVSPTSIHSVSSPVISTSSGSISSVSVYSRPPRASKTKANTQLEEYKKDKLKEKEQGSPLVKEKEPQRINPVRSRRKDKDKEDGQEEEKVKMHELETATETTAELTMDLEASPIITNESLMKMLSTSCGFDMDVQNSLKTAQEALSYLGQVIKQETQKQASKRSKSSSKPTHHEDEPEDSDSAHTLTSDSGDSMGEDEEDDYDDEEEEEDEEEEDEDDDEDDEDYVSRSYPSRARSRTRKSSRVRSRSSRSQPRRKNTKQDDDDDDDDGGGGGEEEEEEEEKSRKKSRKRRSKKNKNRSSEYSTVAFKNRSRSKHMMHELALIKDASYVQCDRQLKTQFEKNLSYLRDNGFHASNLNTRLYNPFDRPLVVHHRVYIQPELLKDERVFFTRLNYPNQRLFENASSSSSSSNAFVLAHPARAVLQSSSCHCTNCLNFDTKIQRIYSRRKHFLSSLGFTEEETSLIPFLMSGDTTRKACMYTLLGFFFCPNCLNCSTTKIHHSSKQTPFIPSIRGEFHALKSSNELKPCFVESGNPSYSTSGSQGQEDEPAVFSCETCQHHVKRADLYTKALTMLRQMISDRQNLSLHTKA